MSHSTLISLAILDVSIEEGKDYISYLNPFVLDILANDRPQIIDEGSIHNAIEERFGLEIPEPVIRHTLWRLTRTHPIEKTANETYAITGEISDPDLIAKKANAERHIQSVISGLIRYSRETRLPIESDQQAIDMLLAFLSQFDISCLKVYLRGTALPKLDESQDTHIVLVSRYVWHLKETDPDRFESFMVLVQGSMLSNALTCPDLKEAASRTFNGVTFYLDTPLLLWRLGLEGEIKKRAVEQLINSLISLHGKIAAFTHSREEAERVIAYSARHLNKPDRDGPIILEARKNNTSKTDLLRISRTVEQRLSDAQIMILPTPAYELKNYEFQIDETAFETALEDEVRYLNPRAKIYDINSVRSIYVLRRGMAPNRLEQAKAVLVSNNTGFATAAFEFGKGHAEFDNVSSVISDTSLANLAWLKSPMHGSSIPKTELLAVSYAALQPTGKVLKKWLKEIERLADRGDITPLDHQVLRSYAAEQKVMNFSLGDDRALTTEAVSDISSDIVGEFIAGVEEKSEELRIAQEKTVKLLEAERSEKKEILDRSYQQCKKRARWITWAIFGPFILILLAGAFSEFIFDMSPPFDWLVPVFSIVAIGASFLTMVFGMHVIRVRNKFEKWLITKCFLDKTGIQISDSDYQA